VQNIPTLLIVVAAALERDDGRFLLQMRPKGRSMAGLWEFPGGKIEGGESPEHALARELKEELAIDVATPNLQPACFASEPLGEKNLILLLYRCRKWGGEPVAVESPQIGWFTVNEMRALPMPPADLPLIDLLEGLSR
jgi:8-oxo-dGTP diphosphatase